MSFEKRIWCYKCNLRIAPYDRKTVFRNRDYHRSCFIRIAQHEGLQAQLQPKSTTGSVRQK
jgi:hypothetical protein